MYILGRVLLFSIAAASVVFAEEPQLSIHEEPIPNQGLIPKEETFVAEEILPPIQVDEVPIRGIVLVTSEETLKIADTSHLEGVVNLDVPLPESKKESSEKFLEELRKKYLGHPLTLEETVKIKRAIIRYYRRQHHPAVAVRIPEQDTSNGVVAFIIVEAKVGAISFEGQWWVSQEHLEKYVDIQSGDFIAEDVLLNNVAWLNRNPFRRTIVTFAPGSEEGTSDLKFVTEDRFPVRFFAGGDNAGTRFTGYTRLYGGLTWGNAFGIDDVLHYQYTIHPNLNKFQSHYGSYTSFLPWKHILSVFGSYETTQRDGKFVQGSFRYTIPFLPLYGPSKAEGTVGADYKNINTNVFFVESHPIYAHLANIFQVLINYSWEWTWEKNELEVALEGFFSPGKVMANQGKKAYHALRPHAKSLYTYGILTAGDVYQLPKNFSLSALLRLQASFDPLLPSEQFGLGGYNTVRGYREREYNADEALCANFEIRSPSFGFFKKCKDEIIFLGFIDYGLGYNLQSSKGNRSSGHLLGAGPGIRYQIDTHFSARVDWGFRLLKFRGEDRGGNVVHIGVEGIF